MKPQKRAVRDEVSARPRPLREESPTEGSEEGLSLDPEALGERFLDYATGNSLPARDGLPELHADGAPASDEAVDGSHFSTDATPWENTANIAIEHGGMDDIAGDAVPAELDELDERGEQEPQRGVAEVDLTANVIQEASLLDDESSVLGETIPKEPRTEDTGPARRPQDDEG
jgi:hypothetical protein